MRSLILFLMIVPLLGAFELGLIPIKISSTVTCETPHRSNVETAYRTLEWEQ
jgi:hypothetical protein